MSRDGTKSGGSKRSGGKGSGGQRSLTVRVKSARGRTTSSTRWLQRQLNDPYVARARAEGYRSRAAYKLIELDDKFHLLTRGARVLDLGAAPGGWTQVAVARVGDKGQVLGVDILEISAIPGATVLMQDFTADDAPQRVREALGGRVDVVLSDMAPNATGQASLDHLRIMGLAELAFHFACEVLHEGGTFVAKVWQGGTEHGLLQEIKQRFSKVRHAKPAASRADSAEMYLVATGFRPAK